MHELSRPQSDCRVRIYRSFEMQVVESERVLAVPIRVPSWGKLQAGSFAPVRLLNRRVVGSSPTRGARNFLRNPLG